MKLYLDAFEVDNPLGSSKGTHKILGFYYTVFTTLEAGSKRATAETIALIFQSDIDHFGINVCLKSTISELKNLVLSGIYDKITKKTLEFRVICTIGDNLGQGKSINEVLFISLYGIMIPIAFLHIIFGSVSKLFLSLPLDRILDVMLPHFKLS